MLGSVGAGPPVNHAPRNSHPTPRPVWLSGSSSIELRVTSTNGERRPFEQAGVTLPVDGSCAAAACGSGKSG